MTVPPRLPRNVASFQPRAALRIARDARVWRPSAASLVYHNLIGRRRGELLERRDTDHLREAAAWLSRAQDATGDGGVAGRYTLGRGWSSSYPETTGYIIPTFLALDAEPAGRLAGFRERARRCVEFLLSVQLPSGAFPGLEIADNREQPSIFNTAQILNGLTAWHRAEGDEPTLEAARRAADWLSETQDADGAWRVHLYGSGRTYTYMAHAACWLAEFGAHVGEERHLDAARRHLAWVLRHVDPATGWIDDCGFGEEDQRLRRAVTHTIAYTIWGILFIADTIGHEAGLDVARQAARAIARRLEISRWLPGKLDANWKPAARYACLTGNAQMALIWLKLHELDADPTLVSAACKAIDLVKQAQSITSNDPGIRGGIAGSDPVWGDYITLAFPNWAAKFFIDALLAKARALASLDVLATRSRGGPVVVHDVPTTLPDASPAIDAPRPRVVFLAGESSPKVHQFCDAWASWAFRPDAVVIQRSSQPSALARLGQYARDYGPAMLAKRVMGGGRRRRASGSTGNSSAPPEAQWKSPAEYCESAGIPTELVASLADADDLARVAALRADVFVYAGCGILRAQVLALPRLGTLNAHMGLLPPMRGMNVAEWSAMLGVQTGATVHLIDTGIDTGDILLFAPVSTDTVRSIDELRDQIDVEQVNALGRTLRWILDARTLPPRRVQRGGEGRQYFTMHSDLRAKLDAALRTGRTVETARSL